MRFDARAASKLAADEHMTFDGFPGLRLQATATRRSWTYRYKSPIDDRMRQVKLGEWPAMAFPAAIAEWERHRAARDAGEDPAATKRLAKEPAAGVLAGGTYTVKQLCNDYMAGHIEPNRKAKGAVEVARMFKSMLVPIANSPASSITRAQAFDFLDSFRATPMLAKRLRMELGGAWSYALDAGRLPGNTPNWWREVMRGRLQSNGRKIEGKSMGLAKRTLSDEELGVLLRWLPNFSRVVSDGVTLYLWTGTRGGEIVSMHADEITEESDGLWWTIPKAKTKNAKRASATDLRVPLVGRAEDVVRRRLDLAKGGFLFPASNGSHGAQTLISHGIYYHQPYCKVAPGHERPRLPVTHWSPHDLRRTVRTMLAAMGCPHEIAESILGHVQPGVVGVYNRHHYDPERRDWLTRLSARLEEIFAARPSK
jgi:integrase